MRRALCATLTLVGSLLLTACHAPVPDRPQFDPATVSEQDVTFHSAALNRDETYRVFQPKSFSRPLPVVFFLHGRGGNFHDWSNLSPIAKLAEQGYLIVMPEGRESYYVNSAGKPADRYEDFITQDLIRDVDARFHTTYTRAIAGVSMGGYGALVLSLHHPGLFAFAGALSPPVEVSRRPFSFRHLLQSRFNRTLFGPADDPHRLANDPAALTRAADPAQMPYLFLSTGQDEYLHFPIDAYEAELKRLNIPHTYQALPGGHDWNEWNAQLPALTAALAAHLPPAAADTADAPATLPK